MYVCFLLSKEVHCILTGLTPIAIKIEKAYQFYHLTKGSSEVEALVDGMEVRYWHHPAETINFLTENKEETNTIHVFTDGSKSEQGVGTGVAIFRSGKHIISLKYRLNKRCTNNQAEQLAIVRALDYTENLQTQNKTATIYTVIRMTLESLENSNIHTFLFEEIRKKLTEIRKTNWKIQSSWVKAHVRIQGNELAETLAKEAATNVDVKESYKKVPKSVVISELGEISVEKWQRELELTRKG